MTDKKPLNKTYTLRNYRLAFRVHFVCDNEMRLNKTVREMNHMKREAEKFQVDKDLKRLCELIRNEIQNRVPKGLAVTVAQEEDWRFK